MGGCKSPSNIDSINLNETRMETMTEIWQWFLVVGGGIVFTVAVWESIIKGHKYFKNR